MGWQEVIVCDKCGYVHSLAFAPKLCPKCAGRFYNFGWGIGKDAHKAIARKTIFGWEFVSKQQWYGLKPKPVKNKDFIHWVKRWAKKAVCN